MNITSFDDLLKAARINGIALHPSAERLDEATLFEVRLSTCCSSKVMSRRCGRPATSGRQRAYRWH